MSDKEYRVRASHCDHRASEEEIYQVLRRTTDPLDRAWEKLEKAQRVVMKFNMIKPRERIEYFAGRKVTYQKFPFSMTPVYLIKDQD